MKLPCTHEVFEADVVVNRLLDDDGSVLNFVAEVRVRCGKDGKPFHFIGVDCGFAFARPTTNVGATLLQAPIKPGEGPIPDRIRFEVS